eukprot:356133-Chlamydomonas_euryale.AAC.4
MADVNNRTTSHTKQLHGSTSWHKESRSADPTGMTVAAANAFARWAHGRCGTAPLACCRRTLHLPEEAQQHKKRLGRDDGAEKCDLGTQSQEEVSEKAQRAHDATRPRSACWDSHELLGTRNARRTCSSLRPTPGATRPS